VLFHCGLTHLYLAHCGIGTWVDHSIIIKAKGKRQKAEEVKGQKVKGKSEEGLNASLTFPFTFCPFCLLPFYFHLSDECCCLKAAGAALSRRKIRVVVAGHVYCGVENGGTIPYLAVLIEPF
jgi:hypothetical protein